MAICNRCGGAGRYRVMYRKTMLRCKDCNGTGQVREAIVGHQIRRDDEGRSVKRLHDEEE